MKRLPFLFSICVSVFLLGYTGCSKQQSGEDDVSKVDTTRYDVQFYNTGTFKTDAGTINNDMKATIEGAKNGKNKFLKSNLTAEESTLFFPANEPIEGVEPVSIDTRTTIKEVFNKTGAGCLKGDDKAAFRHMAKNRVPENLRIHTQDQTMSYYQGIPGILILSHFKIERAAGGEAEHYTLPSGRVGVSSVLDLINPGDADSYIYQMDCSGYLTFALTVGATVPGITKINSAGEASGNAQRSTIIAYGKFASPLAIAMKPGPAFNLEFQDAARKQVLQNILNAPSTAIGNNDVIVVNNYYYLLIASTEGESGLNGKVATETIAGGTLGVVSASGSSTSGMKYSRSVKFTEYNTYVSSRLDNTPTNETRLTGAQLRAAIAAIR